MISFEVFPPRTPEGEARLQETLDSLVASPAELRLGHLRRRRQRHSTPTFEVLEGVNARGTLRAAGHMTCVARSRDEVDAEVMRYWDAGIRHIVALRGDVPGWEGPFQPHPAGYASSVELVTAIRRLGPFEVSVACYPEPHPDSSRCFTTSKSWRARPRPAPPARSPSSASTPTRS